MMKLKSLVSSALMAVLAPSISLADCSPRSFNTFENTVIDAYIAYYGRVPDAAGLAWWQNELSNQNGDLAQIIEAFGNSDEFDRNFGNLDAPTLINNLYQQAFGRDADDGGLAFYSEELSSGRMSLQTIALGILNGAQNEDAEIINNRRTAAQHYVTSAEANQIEFGETEMQQLLPGIGSSADSANTVCDSVSGQFAELGATYEGNGSLACSYSDNPVNWQLLLDSDATNLSEYNLFSNSADPTRNPNCGGLPYDMVTPLFTDYASKYRFIFVPEGQKVLYTENESFEFPVGTVITKTFSLPGDTAFRGQNETLIETRLLIRREAGWKAIPYIWNEDKTDAVRSIAGGIQSVSLIHNGQQKDFSYAVPDQNKCKQCHQLQSADGSVTPISPIGPKARNLNHDYNYNGVIANQVYHWADVGFLSGLPLDPARVDAIAAYNDGDEAALSGKSDDEIMQLAKGYLDINCAHCHRPEGNASNTGLHLEYWRTFASDKSKHGVCKKPIAYGGGALEYDVVPGNPDRSILHFRMNSDEPGDRMPEIGKSLVHDEGVALIAEWIRRLPADTCSE